jgi:hypothetical protein
MIYEKYKPSSLIILRKGHEFDPWPALDFRLGHYRIKAFRGLVRLWRNFTPPAHLSAYSGVQFESEVEF